MARSTGAKTSEDHRISLSNKLIMNKLCFLKLIKLILHPELEN